MTTPHDKALSAAVLALQNAEATHDGSKPWIEHAASQVVSTYLSSIGGIVCAREPAEHQRLVPGFGWQRVNDEDLSHYSAKGMPRRTLHTPIPEAGNGGDGWLPIKTAPKDGTYILVAAYYDTKPTVSCAYWPEADEWFWWHDQEYSLSENGFEARFWRPLPAPPSTPSYEEREKA